MCHQSYGHTALGTLTQIAQGNTFGKNFLTTLPLTMHMELSMMAHASNTST